MKRQFSILLAVATILLCAVNVNAVSTPEEATYSVDQLIAKASSLVGKSVQVKGICNHVCATSGRKIFLRNADGTKLFRFNAGSKISRFDPAARTKEVTIQGVVAEQRIFKEDLDRQEARALEAEKVQAVKKEHCTTDAKANGEDERATPVQRIRAQKNKLDKQIAAGGKNYLAIYTVNECNDYSIAK